MIAWQTEEDLLSTESTVFGANPTPPPAERTPEQWIANLWRQLESRKARIQLFEDYYQGKQRLRFTTLKMRETFGNEFGAFAANYCLLVVDAVEERLRVTGFRVLSDDGTGQPEAPAEEASETPAEEVAEETTAAQQITNDEAWRIWRANDLDANSSMVHNAALVAEMAYVIVWANEADKRTPVITVESPFEVITDDAPGATMRRAALKRWIDADDGKWRATLYLPNAIYKYTSKRTAKQSKNPAAQNFWDQRQQPGEPWPLPNPVGIVPVIPLHNNPRLGPGQQAVSEIASVIPIQDAINKTVTDMLVASEFVAYPQRYMVGVGLPKDENDQPMEPFKAGVDRIWFVEQPEGALIAPTIGEFPQANLDPYVHEIEMFVGSIASITKTPRHYLIESGGGTNLSGETVKALEAGLVSKARKKQRVFGDAWEEVMALAFAFQKNAGFDVPTLDEEAIQVQWADPETRTEAQHIDALLKLGLLRVPTEQLWLDAGYTPEDVKRFKALAEASPPPTNLLRPSEVVTPAQELTEVPTTPVQAAMPMSPAMMAGAPKVPPPRAL